MTTPPLTRSQAHGHDRVADQNAIKQPSPDFPFESKFAEVLGSKMHYIDVGEGAPILFLHGNPTSSYLWRNVIPHLSSQGRCIAVDLIGMGQSDKPDIDYTFADQVRHLDGFIEALRLEDIALILHDWGSALGFHYAARHPENVRAIAFMEATVKPLSSDFAPLSVRLPLKMMRTPILGALIARGANLMLTKMLPDLIVRELTPEELARYRAPYPSFSSRKVLHRFPQMIPLDGKPAEVHDAFARFSQYLQQSPVPKLMLRVEPGIAIPAETAAWIREHVPNLDEVFLGHGLHFIQEDYPDEIGEAIQVWHADLASAQATTPARR